MRGWWLIAALAGCGDLELPCGAGTKEVDGLCVPDDDAGADSDAIDTDAGDTDAGDTDAGDTDAEDTDAEDTDEPPATIDHRVVGYFAEWGVYDRDYQVADIPAQHLTHVNYAFADLAADGTCQVFDSWAALDMPGATYAALHDLRVAHPHLKVLVSVGGWTLSGNFSANAATAAGRTGIVDSCVDFMLLHGFDGIDLDWEYPVSGGLQAGTPADRANFTALLAAFRDRLTLEGPEYELTIAAPAGPSAIANFEIDLIHEHLDAILLMSYDFHGSWEATTGHNAPVTAADGLSVDAAVQTWLTGGVPPEKLIVGLPLFGRGWSGVGPANDGLGQAGSGVPSGTWEAGMFDYSDLLANYVGQGDWQRHWDPTARVPWLYSPGQQVFISYDDEQSFAEKLAYVTDEGLGGAMVWELSADAPGHPRMAQIAAALLP